MWDLGSSIRDGTCVPHIAGQILNRWTTREVPRMIFPFFRDKIVILTQIQNEHISEILFNSLISEGTSENWLKKEPKVRTHTSGVWNTKINLIIGTRLITIPIFHSDRNHFYYYQFSTTQRVVK